MNIPAIGTARGVFELFVPGAFVILNFFAFLYSWLDSTAQEQFRELAASPVLGLVILICLGYLVGAILRLFGTEIPDRCSAWWNRPQTKTASSKHWTEEDFPYIGWIGLTHNFREENAKTGSSAQKFYDKVWKVEIKGEGGSKDRNEEEAKRWQEKTFFNHCKTLINSVDERAATEIYSAEALVRYLTGMFYALLLAMSLMALGLVKQLVPQLADKGWWLFLVLLVAYMLMFLPIIRS